MNRGLQWPPSHIHSHFGLQVLLRSSPTTTNISLPPSLAFLRLFSLSSSHRHHQQLPSHHQQSLDTPDILDNPLNTTRQHQTSHIFLDILRSHNGSLKHEADLPQQVPCLCRPDGPQSRSQGRPCQNPCRRSRCWQHRCSRGIRLSAGREEDAS